MSGVDGAGAADRPGDGRPTLALVGALRAELADALRAVAWYGDGDRGLLYVHGDVDAPDRRLGATLRRRPVADGGGGADGRLVYAIDAYEEVVVVALSPQAFDPPTGDVAGVALAIERDAPLGEIIAAIERGVASYRQAR